MVYFKNGWVRLRTYIPTEHSIEPKFSIIIPARNEEKNIGFCLLRIINQSYASNLFELIIVDDYSEDKTAETVKQIIKEFPHISISLLAMSDYPKVKNSFKKAALKVGIDAAKNEWIITTDADCLRNEKWLQTIAFFITDENPVFISAPVSFYSDKSFFQRIQSLEFLGLIAIGAACIQRKHPILCNGANLVYKKEVFYEVGAYENIDGIASGDDELLMHKIHEKYPDEILFLKHPDAIVYTAACDHLSQFIQQRKRWVSKSTTYKNKWITIILILNYLYNLCILACIILAFYKFQFALVTMWLLVVKISVEYDFYREVLKFFKQRALIKWVIPASFLHIVYVLFIGIYGNFGKYKWKGRIVK